MHTLSIVVERRPGLLAQIVSALGREGCRLLRQSVSPAEHPARQRFTITVDGPEAALHNLPRVLSSFGSVEARESGGPAGEEPRSTDVDRSAQEIVAAFPDVAERVRMLALSLPAASRAETLAALGERLGRREYARSYALGSPLKLEAALRRMVLPALRQLARADLEGLALRLASCPFCDDAGTGRSGCDFLVGFARGLLRAAPATAGAGVRQGRCRSAGAPLCEIVFFNP